ncbi:MAG: ATP-binding cassette domain-containing protein [Parvibaculum sp.]|nr:ATP-binding cassette domain-containing protein [Parvibaculum sp.]
MSVPKGRRVGFIGESGSGKTTTALAAMRMLAAPGFVAGGSIRLNGVGGTDLLGLNDEEMRRVRLRKISYIPQGAMNSLNPVMRVETQIWDGIVAHEGHVEPGELQRRSREVLAGVGLEPHVGQLYPHELSGGMKRRVMIAKALSHEPDILFLDEPTAGVDVELRRDMWEMVRGLRASGVTIILTTHYIEEAEEMADRVGVINHGEIVVVEEKNRLMKKLGKKQLAVHLRAPLAAIPDALSGRPLELADDGHTLVYSFDAQADESGIPELLKKLGEIGVDFRDLRTHESSLEEIFVSLVRARA